MRARLGRRIDSPRPAPWLVPVSGLVAASLLVVVGLVGSPTPAPQTAQATGERIGEAPEAAPQMGEELDVRMVKMGDVVRLEWDGDADARYQVTRCFVRPGRLEACEQVHLTQDTTWIDPVDAPPFELVIYRVTQVG